MLVFEEMAKTECSEKNRSEQRRDSITNSSQRRRQNSNPGDIDGMECSQHCAISVHAMYILYVCVLDKFIPGLKPGLSLKLLIA